MFGRELVRDALRIELQETARDDDKRKLRNTEFWVGDYTTANEHHSVPLSAVRHNEPGPGEN